MPSALAAMRLERAQDRRKARKIQFSVTGLEAQDCLRWAGGKDLCGVHCLKRIGEQGF